MNVGFVGDSRTGWSDDIVEVTHEIRWEPDGQLLLSVVRVRNQSPSELWVPVPLVMPFGGERKNCLRVFDRSNKELQQRGVHVEFRTDEARRQVLPYDPLELGENREWRFDLVDHFPALGEGDGEFTVRLTYMSPAKSTLQFDIGGSLRLVSSWEGHAEVPAIRIQLTAGS